MVGMGKRKDTTSGNQKDDLSRVWNPKGKGLHP